MFLKLLQDNTSNCERQSSALQLLDEAERYTSEVRLKLDAAIDGRLVKTFFNLFAIILMFRERRMGLLLSELGGFLCGHDKAPAGTKRVSNLLRCPKWKSQLIDDHFFDHALARIKRMANEGKRALLLWDDSQIEKHESWTSEGLCSVWSSKAKRLTRIRPGYYHPPKDRICVPGFKWTGVFLSCLGSSPSVCQMRWWTTRGKFKEDPDNIIWGLLKKLAQQLTDPVLHVFDRGYASEKMIRYLLRFDQQFLIRWKKNVYLNHEGQRLRIDKISRKTKAQSCKIIYDKERKKHRKISIAWSKVEHPEHPDNQLFLIVVRNVKHPGGPMYLLCNVPISNATIAWEILSSYVHRWEAEQGFRFLKTELSIESPRLWFWENRLKLMAIVTLVYDFLLKTLRKGQTWVQAFFRKWCHRTGERYRNASIPLYRLRMAISICLTKLWAQSSG